MSKDVYDVEWPVGMTLDEAEEFWAKKLGCSKFELMLTWTSEAERVALAKMRNENSRNALIPKLRAFVSKSHFIIDIGERKSRTYIFCEIRATFR